MEEIKYKQVKEYKVSAENGLKIKGLKESALESFIKIPQKGFLKGHLADSPCN